MVSSGGDNGGTPREGYYPDPSIPGYVRYWNGSAWVPGTSRPQPADGEALNPPGGAAPAAPRPAAPPPSAARPEPRPSAPRPPDPRPAVPRPAAPDPVEQSGPMFLDEDPAAPVAQTPAEQTSAGPGPAAPARAAGAAAGWDAAPVHPSGSPRDAPQAGRDNPDAHASVPLEGGYGYPRTAPPATASTPGGHGYPAERRLPGAPGGYGYPPPAAGAEPAAGPHPAGPPGAGPAVPWQRQVRDLARPDGPGAPGAEAHALPWRPPAADPFAQAAEPARPAGTGRRLAARLLDTVLVGAVVSAATAPLAVHALHHLQHKIDAARLSGENVRVWLIDGTTGAYLGALLGGLLLAGVLYEVLPTARWGRTLGKRAFRLRVLDIESQLTPGLGQALRRMLVRQVLDFAVVGVLNVAWCVVDRPWRQCWHDKVARTFVADD